MQRLADFQRRAWRCESPSPPNASLQRQHTGMYTFFAHTHTHCLPLPSANPQHQHNPLSAPRRCNRAKQATSLVASPRHAGSGPCLRFCFSGRHARPALFKVCAQYEQIIWQKGRNRSLMSVLVHEPRPSLSSRSQCVWGKQSVRFDFLTT